jgi:aldehyde:ferredoxin oxidoreductase
MYGYGGQILRINLSTGKISKTTLSEGFAKTYIGGRGFGAKILWDEVRNVQPLAEDNKLIISAGPLSGLFVPGCGKTHFTAKSPLTCGYGDSNMGGLFSPEMKYAGYDVFIIEGKSAGPVYVYIHDDLVEIRDASSYWNKGSITTELELKKDLGEEFQILTIGQGGENLVKYACITTDIGRQAGRAGLGAVMGSKNLKSIVVRGENDIQIADMTKFMEIAEKSFTDCYAHDNLKIWQKLGTSQVPLWASSIGAFPSKNFQYGTYEHAEEIDGTTMFDKGLIKLNKACFGCPMCCGKYSYTPKYDKYVEGAEYETIALLGSNCGITDIEDILMANYLCDEYGIDTISTGNVIGFVMECAEKGIIDEDIKFGDTDKYLDLIRKIAFREGIGDVLAEGVKVASEKFGATDLAVHVKGMEQSGYESRAAPAMALSYMTCDVGAHHNRSWAITYDMKVGRDTLQGKAEWVIHLQHVRPMFDMLGVCRLQWVELELNLEYYGLMYSAVTGWNYTTTDLLVASERVYNLTRAYWFREVKDFGRKYDLPPISYTRPVPKGVGEGYKLDNEIANTLLTEYYKKRGWNTNGKPTSEKLSSLGLHDVNIEIR